jgi:hypothetical protein
MKRSRYGADDRPPGGENGHVFIEGWEELDPRKHRIGPRWETVARGTIGAAPVLVRGPRAGLTNRGERSRTIRRSPMNGLLALTLFHVVLSLIGIVAGFVAMFGWLRQKALPRWTLVFLVTTILTSVTGFLFPFTQFLPSHAFGILSLLVLPVAVAGRYAFHLRGPWRWLYTVSSVLALYLNMFVLIVQAFQKIPALKALAPTQTEPAFAMAQLVNLAFFVWLGIVTTARGKALVLSPAS